MHKTKSKALGLLFSKWRVLDVQLLWVIVERNQETQKGHYLSVMAGVHLLNCFHKKVEKKSFFSKSVIFYFLFFRIKNGEQEVQNNKFRLIKLIETKKK
jgi:hypothetical protein